MGIDATPGPTRRLVLACAPSTPDTYLRSFTHGDVKQLDAVASRLLAGLAARGGGAVGWRGRVRRAGFPRRGTTPPARSTATPSRESRSAAPGWGRDRGQRGWCRRRPPGLGVQWPPTVLGLVMLSVPDCLVDGVGRLASLGGCGRRGTAVRQPGSRTYASILSAWSAAQSGDRLSEIAPAVHAPFELRRARNISIECIPPLHRSRDGPPSAGAPPGRVGRRSSRASPGRQPSASLRDDS